MAKAKKLPSGNWRCMGNCTIDGKKVRKSFTAPTKREAEFLAAEFVREGTQAPSDCIVSKALDNYITNRSNTCSPSTIAGYRQLQRTYYSSLDNMRVSSVTSEDLQRFVNTIAADHAPKTVWNIYSLLESCLSSITQKNYLVNLPQKAPYEYHIPTDKDVKNLIEQSDEYLKIGILLASIGTMRRSEICALEYRDIKDNTIHVRRSRVRDEYNNWIIKDIPKTSKSDRYIVFPPQVIEQIGEGEGLIIPITPGAFSHRYDKLRRKLGIDCRFHDLRHYAASIMHAIGIPDQYIMEVGGWSSDAILKAVYRNVLDDKQKEFTAKRNDYFSDKILS